MPASAMVTIRSFSPCLSFTGLLSARSSASLRSGAIDGGFGLAPFGLPLFPGLNRYSLGGRPGPTLYSASDAAGCEAAEQSVLLRPHAPSGNLLPTARWRGAFFVMSPSRRDPFL